MAALPSVFPLIWFVCLKPPPQKKTKKQKEATPEKRPSEAPSCSGSRHILLIYICFFFVWPGQRSKKPKPPRKLAQSPGFRGYFANFLEDFNWRWLLEFQKRRCKRSRQTIPNRECPVTNPLGLSLDRYGCGSKPMG